MSQVVTSSHNRFGQMILLTGFIAITVRLYINFSSELLSGNGGYYPLQVRTLLERGELGFSDMPLLFYLNAGIVKLLSFVGFGLTDTLILNTVKFMDAVVFPLILIPCYYLIKHVAPTLRSGFTLAIGAYLVLSFVPMTLLSSFQKNAFAIVLLFSAITCWVLYTKTEQRKFAWWTGIFLLCTGLAHFGTFMFALLFLVFFLAVRYRKRAILPIVLASVIGIILVLIFDLERANRIAEFVGNTFTASGLFRGHILGQLLKWVFYWFTAFLAIRFMRKQKELFLPFDKVMIWTCIVLLVVVPVPLYDGQFADRLTNFLFIPQCILLIYFGTHLSKRPHVILTTVLLLIGVGSLGLNLIRKAPTDVPERAYTELQSMQVANPDETIIVSRHNLEFWVAWSLKTKVAQESEFNSSLQEKYKHVLVLNQTKGLRRQPKEMKGGMNPFQEPTIPENAVLVDSTEHFVLYEVF